MRDLQRTKGNQAPEGGFFQMSPIRVYIPQHHMIIFTDDLVHSGDGYLIENIRYHLNFDHRVTGEEECV